MFEYYFYNEVTKEREIYFGYWLADALKECDHADDLTLLCTTYVD